MNRDLIDQLPADEQPVAERLTAAATQIMLAPDFRSNLEIQLMDAFPSQQERASRLGRLLKPAVWAVTAAAGILLAAWMLRTLLPGIQPAVEITPVQEVSFAERVQQGDICTGRLAAVHGFVVSVSNTEKTEFMVLDSNEAVGEFRSFAWSRDGQQLAMLGNTMGGGSIYVVDSSGSQLQYIVDPSEFGYMYGMAWSRDGKQFATWSGQDNTRVYLLDATANTLVKQDLGVQLLGALQFTPDGTGIVFRGADTQSGGLFEASLEDSRIELISDMVEDETGFAFSPDGSHLAYVEMDRAIGEARLVALERSTGNKSTLGTLSIPKGSGSSIPELANLSWSQDGRSLAFDIGYGAGDRAIYLAFIDGTPLHKVVDSGYAPTISPDGQCLAYIRNAQVFLLELAARSGSATETTPILLADLPTGKVIPNYELDQLEWSPEP